MVSLATYFCCVMPPVDEVSLHMPSTFLHQEHHFYHYLCFEPCWCIHRKFDSALCCVRGAEQKINWLHRQKNGQKPLCWSLHDPEQMPAFPYIDANSSWAPPPEGRSLCGITLFWKVKPNETWCVTDRWVGGKDYMSCHTFCCEAHQHRNKTASTEVKWKPGFIHHSTRHGLKTCF